MSLYGNSSASVTFFHSHLRQANSSEDLNHIGHHRKLSRSFPRLGLQPANLLFTDRKNNVVLIKKGFDLIHIGRFHFQCHTAFR